MTVCYILLAACITAIVVTFIFARGITEDYDHELRELKAQLTDSKNDIRALQNACTTVRDTIAGIVKDLHMLSDCQDGLCEDMGGFDEQLAQMGEVLEKSIWDNRIREEINDIRRQIEEIRGSLSKLVSWPISCTTIECGVTTSSELGADDTDYNEEDVYHE